MVHVPEAQLPFAIAAGRGAAGCSKALTAGLSKQRKYLECIGEVQGGLSIAFLPWQQQ